MVQTPEQNSGVGMQDGLSLVRSDASREPLKDERELTARLQRLPVEVDVRIPLPSFRVCDLLSLEPGRVLSSTWPTSEDLPLSSGDVQLVWSEFEVVDQKLAVRVTRLV